MSHRVRHFGQGLLSGQSGLRVRPSGKRPVAIDPRRKSARINTCTELCVEIRFYVDRNGLSGSAHVGRLELVAIAGEHAHVTPGRNRTVVSCENT